MLSSAQALMKHGGMKYGVAFESWNYDNIAFMGGGRILDASLKPVIDKAPTPQVYQWFADLINVHKVAPTSEVPAGTYLTNFGNGQVGMYISGAWWGIDYMDPVVRGKFAWADVVMPEVNGHVGCKLELDAVSIYAGSKDPQAAWDFISTVTNRRGEQIWTAAATPTRLSILRSKGYRSLPFAATVQEMVRHSTYTPFTKAGSAVDNACTAALSPMWLGQQKATVATKSAAAALATALASV
jgi:ABC-type glycerol-3-phosphate transport system substrate-binding protein